MPDRPRLLWSPPRCAAQVRSLTRASPRAPAAHALSGSLLFDKNVLEHLFDCLEAVVPAADDSARQSGRAQADADGDVRLQIFNEQEYLVLRVQGLPCAAVRGALCRNYRSVAIIECLQLQAQIMSLIAGVLRAGWRLHAWQAGGGGGCKWHHQQLGFFPYVLWRLMKSKEGDAKLDGPEAKFTLWTRIAYSSQWFEQDNVGDTNSALYRLLRNKINSALKVALLSSLDMGWEGGESKLLLEGVPGKLWVNAQTNFVCVNTQSNKSSQVVAALMVARILTQRDHIEPDAFEGPYDHDSIFALAARTLEDVAEQLSSEATGELGPSHGLSKADEVFGRPPEHTAVFLCQAFEALEALAKSSCLFTSTEGCWESDWVEQLNRFGRQVLLESVGVLCFALKYLAVEPPANPAPAEWRANFIEFYHHKDYGNHVLAAADHAVNAVIKGWPSLQETLEEKVKACASFSEWRDSAHMDPNTPTRLEGLEFLLSECGKSRMQIQPKFGILRGPQQEPLNIQLTTVVNVLFAVDADAAMDADPGMATSGDDQYEALLEDAAAALVHLGAEPLPRFQTLKELLRRVVFCLSRARHSLLYLTRMEKRLVQQFRIGLHRRGADAHVDGTLQSALRHLAITAAENTYKDIGGEDGGEDGRWKEVLELTLEAIGWYVWHAELEDAGTVDGGEDVECVCATLVLYARASMYVWSAHMSMHASAHARKRARTQARAQTHTQARAQTHTQTVRRAARSRPAPRAQRCGAAPAQCLR